MKLQDLNTQQLKAVQTVNKPVLVFAGAGSGKTRVLTYKVWHLIKENLFKKHGKDAKDTGSTEGQIALFTHRINHLTGHLKQNRKDFNTERSLVKLVGKRRSLLDYLMKKDILRYRAIVKELGLRK